MFIDLKCSCGLFKYLYLFGEIDMWKKCSISSFDGFSDRSPLSYLELSTDNSMWFISICSTIQLPYSI